MAASSRRLRYQSLVVGPV
ncbi:hypothetical protein A2U01_0103918, partial [Trifolium medium]|nr:hypothetical protein [Trifolium medium]